MNLAQISRELDIPRGTIRDWIVMRRADLIAERCHVCESAQHDFSVLTSQYDYLFGLYLGDGCLSKHPRDVYKLRVSLDLKYPDIIEECRTSMSFVSNNKVGLAQREGAWVDVYAYSKAWPCLFPQHGPGMKHTRPIILTDWQKEIAQNYPKQLIRGLIHSDGTRCINNDRGVKRTLYQFKNRSDDILDIFLGHATY